MKFFSKFVKYPVISDDSGLCIKALKGKPGIHSARFARQKGGFLKAMKFILKKIRKKKIDLLHLYAILLTDIPMTQSFLLREK